LSDVIKKIDLVVENNWEGLKAFTDARIALGRTGHAIPTNKLLEFQLGHAQARDAVHVPLDSLKVNLQLRDQLKGLACFPQLFRFTEPLVLKSEAVDRITYLQRPDLGRIISAQSHEQLKKYSADYDIAICIVDGLSSKAIDVNVSPFLDKLLTAMEKLDFNYAPLSICSEGRVAIGDSIAETLGAKLAIVLIGERPGLSSPDSMGLYLTFNPSIGCNDAQRNCISNIRLAGLSYSDAVEKCLYLIKESNRLGFSGVNLKERININLTHKKNNKNFLTQHNTLTDL
jgi:ethanolamine ammonia-lyase small subunit